MYQIQSIKKPWLLVLVSTLLLFGGCKSSLTNEDAVYKMATTKLGSEIDSIPSSTGEYILFIQKANSLNASNHLKFLVISVAQHKVMLEQSFNPGYAKWITDSSIEVLSVPGVIQENEDLSRYKKIININPSNP